MLDATSRALVLKAAFRYADDRRDKRYKSIVMNTRLSAFAEVAADVLLLVRAPFAFELGIMEAFEAYPVPGFNTTQASKAALARSEWAKLFIAAFEASVGDA